MKNLDFGNALTHQAMASDAQLRLMGKGSKPRVPTGLVIACLAALVALPAAIVNLSGLIGV